MKNRLLLAFGLLLVVVAVAIPQRFREIKASLLGYEEVPAVSTAAGGEFRARIVNNESEIRYELNYSDLEGDVQQAHIHFGQPGVNGGIVVFLCSNLGNGPAGTQPCPPPPASISGILTASDMVGGAAAQGIAPGDFSELIRAIRENRAYVNVHSTLFPGGEIRGHIDPSGGKP